MAKLQARTWLSRAVSSSFSSVLARCAKCTMQPRSCLYLCQIFTYFNFFLTRRLSNKPFLIWLLTTPSRLKYVARLRCNLSLMACFADINVSQGSVATYARCGGSFNIYLTTHLPRSFALIFFKSVKIWQNYGHGSVAHFFGQPCILNRQLFMSNVALIRFVCSAVFLLRSFNFCLLYLFTYFVLPYKMAK